jgi:hypothetical protein
MKHEPAFPTTGGQIFYGEDGVASMPLTTGLTKREYMAIHLYAAACANPYTVEMITRNTRSADVCIEKLIESTLKEVDALLAALGKTEGR